MGGFTPFDFELGSYLREHQNFIVVKVDNQRHRNGVPTVNTAWWNYGGLTRDVSLVEFRRPSFETTSCSSCRARPTGFAGGYSSMGRNSNRRSSSASSGRRAQGPPWRRADPLERGVPGQRV